MCDGLTNCHLRRYDDGDRELRVKPSLVRKTGALEKRSSSPRRPSGRPGGVKSRNSDEFDVGARVEARYGGGKKWYKGKITRVNSDRTYAIM